MTKKQIEHVSECIVKDEMFRFYTWRTWRRLRDAVLAECKHECQRCKAKGIYSKAIVVHHVLHVKEHPELALERHYLDEYGIQRRQLMPVCSRCHEDLHPEKARIGKWTEPVTVERWD